MITDPKILAVLVLLAAGAIGVELGQRYYFYLFPRELCYTRSGVFLGGYEPEAHPRCFREDVRPVAQIDVGPLLGGAVRTDTHRVCQSLCRTSASCSHYVLGLPRKYYERDLFGLSGKISSGSRSSFNCVLFEEAAR